MNFLSGIISQRNSPDSNRNGDRLSEKLGSRDDGELCFVIVLESRESVNPLKLGRYCVGAQFTAAKGNFRA